MIMTGNDMTWGKQKAIHVAVEWATSRWRHRLHGDGRLHFVSASLNLSLHQVSESQTMKFILLFFIHDRCGLHWWMCLTFIVQDNISHPSANFVILHINWNLFNIFCRMLCKTFFRLFPKKKLKTDSGTLSTSLTFKFSDNNDNN